MTSEFRKRVYELFKEQSEIIEIDGIRRSVYNSNGDKIGNDEQSLLNFWNWFSDSITIDNQGRPLVFFHGTDKEFTEFKAGYKNGLVFFAYNKSFADNYGKTKSINNNNYNVRKTLACYLKIKKIFIPKRDYELLTDTIIEVFKFYNNIKELLNKSNLTNDERKQVEEFNNIMWMAENGSYIVLERDEIVDKIWSLGFDALELSENEEETTTLAVREGYNQIKSVDNNGNWSTSSSNIYK